LEKIKGIDYESLDFLADIYLRIDHDESTAKKLYKIGVRKKCSNCMVSLTKLYEIQNKSDKAGTLYEQSIQTFKNKNNLSDSKNMINLAVLYPYRLI